MKNEKIGIIILNFNGSSDTIDCLESIYASSLGKLSLRVLIVDNGSKNTEVEKLSNYIRKNSTRFKNINLELLILKENTGFSGGNNAGIKHFQNANLEAILFLNNDTIVSENTIKQLYENLFKEKEAGITVPLIYFYKGNEYHSAKYKDNEKGRVVWYAGGLIDWMNVYFTHKDVDLVDNGKYQDVEETEFATGCAMMVKTDVLQKTGFFNDDYFLYLEDVEFSLRVKKLGYTIIFVPFAKIWHKNASSSDKPGSAIHIYYQTRNRLLFGFKYASARTKFALFRESLKMFLLNPEKRAAIRDFYFHHYGKR